MSTLPQADLRPGQSVIICLLAFFLASELSKYYIQGWGSAAMYFRRRRSYLTSASCSGED
jgi:hypothetical protein